MGRRGYWVYDPNSGGVKIPESLKSEITEKVKNLVASNYKKEYNRIDVRFRSQFLYVDIYREPFVAKNFSSPYETRKEKIDRLRNVPLQLCRLRYKSSGNWCLALYRYGPEKYEPALLSTGDWMGNLEEAIMTATEFWNEVY